MGEDTAERQGGGDLVGGDGEEHGDADAGRERGAERHAVEQRVNRQAEERHDAE